MPISSRECCVSLLQENSEHGDQQNYFSEAVHKCRMHVARGPPGFTLEPVDTPDVKKTCREPTPIYEFPHHH